MMKDDKLYLHEEILLLALNDEKGTIHFGASFAQAAGGALLADLLLAERLTIEEKTKKKPLVQVRDATPVGEPLLDACLARVVEETKPRKAVVWVQRFATTKNLKEKAAARLVERRVLKEEEDRILRIFKRTVYPEADSRPERAIIERLRRAIVGSSREIEPRTVVLVALAHHTGLLQRAVEKRKLKERKERIEKLIQGEIAGRATKQAVEAMQAALLAAVIVPTIVASTTATS